MPQQKDFQRLPLDPNPLHYDLSYTRISLEAFDFEGEVEILLDFDKTFQHTEETVITLNSLDLNISSAKLSDGRKAERILLVPGAQTVEFTFPGPTSCGVQIKLYISFQGKLNDLLAGFYRSKLNDQGEYLGCTQFEATDARRAFPCWDEPARKATFRLKLTLPAQYLALSNTKPQSRHFTSSQEQVVEFYPTPKMSTYLLAWVVAPRADCFDMLAQSSKRNPQIETVVYVSKGKLEQAKFASKVAVEALDFFIDLFDMDYPLPLQQHIAIPDFAAGAMENWGLVTYREVRLLVEEGKTSSDAKRNVARTVSHEISHFFFGNSTTMEWWSDLYLNESFARYHEFVCVDHIFPELDVFTTFAVEVVGVALRLDSLKSTHAVRIEVKHPSEISEIFDTISYAKGGSLLQMCVHFMGSLNAFETGVRRYLKEFRYRNAESKDLWRSLEPEMPGLTKIMEQWTDQVGYPVIYVDESGRLTQERYLTIQEQSNSEKQQWTMPLLIVSPLGQSLVVSTPTHHAVDNQQQQGEVIPVLHNGQLDWFVLNGNADLFRVRYTDQQFRNIFSEGFPSGILPVRARIAVVRDLFDLVESAHAGLALALELGLQALQVERHATVLLVLVSKLQVVLNMFTSGGASGEGENGQFVKFRDMAAKAVAPVVQALGPWKLADEEYFDGNGGALNELRVAVLRFAFECGGAYDAIGAKADEITRKHCAKDQQACPNDLRACVFRLAVGNPNAQAARASLELLFQRFPMVDSPEQREIISSFAGVKTREHIQLALQFAVTKVRGQDVPSAVAAICSASSFASELVWEDFQVNFDSTWSKFANGGFFLWSTIVSAIAGGLPTVESANRVKTFFEVEHPGKLGSAQRGLDQALERVAAKQNQTARYRAEMQEFLDVLTV